MKFRSRRHRLDLRTLALRRLSAVLYGLFEPILVQPPVKRVGGDWQTWVRADIIRFLESWRPNIKGRVLDVGGGTWEFPRKLLSEQCDYKLADCLEHPNVDIIVDIHRLTDTFPMDSFDYLLCCDVLEHVTEPACAARQMCLILKPGGKLLLTTPFNFHIHAEERVPDLWRITEQGLRHILSMFSEVRIEPRGRAQFPRSYLVVATK